MSLIVRARNWVDYQLGELGTAVENGLMQRRSDVTRWVASPYRVHDGRAIDQYFEQIATNYQELCNGFDYYVALIEGLRAVRGIDLCPAYELAADSTSKAPRVTLRHDVDADPETGLRLARHLARAGVCGTFYLLHSAPYYSDVHDGVIMRQPRLVQWVRGYIVAGCELGLHNDALGVFREHGFDPIAVLQAELAWLRAQGANVRGTSAHNSISSNGAENYEIFFEHRLWRRDLCGRDGRVIPLGSIRMQNLNLAYEGTFAAPRETLDMDRARSFASSDTVADIRSERWMREYLTDNPVCRWTVDFQIWLLGRDRWVVAGRHRGETIFEWDVRLPDVLRFVSELPARTRTLFVLHPEYFGDYPGA